MAVEVGVLVCSLFESGPAKTEAGVEAQKHDILCSFKLNGGAEETYTGKLLGAGLSGEHKGTLLWLVDAPPTVMPSPAGLLQAKLCGRCDGASRSDPRPDRRSEFAHRPSVPGRQRRNKYGCRPWGVAQAEIGGRLMTMDPGLGRR